MSLDSLEAWEERERDQAAYAVTLAKELRSTSSSRFRRLYNFDFQLLNKHARRFRDRELISLTIQDQIEVEKKEGGKRYLSFLLLPLVLLGVFILLNPPDFIKEIVPGIDGFRIVVDLAEPIIQRAGVGYSKQSKFPPRVWIGLGKELKWQPGLESDDSLLTPEERLKKNFERLAIPSANDPLDTRGELILQSFGKAAFELPGANGPVLNATAEASPSKLDPKMIANQENYFAKAIGKSGSMDRGFGDRKPARFFLGSNALSAEERVMLASTSGTKSNAATAQSEWQKAFQTIAPGQPLPGASKELQILKDIAVATSPAAPAPVRSTSLYSPTIKPQANSKEAQVIEQTISPVALNLPKSDLFDKKTSAPTEIAQEQRNQRRP